MINKHTTKKLILILAVINVAFFALYIFLYLRVEAHETKTADIYRKIGASEEGAQALEALEMSVQNTEEYRDALEKYLVSEDETVRFLEEVEGLGRFSGSSVKLTAVKKESSGENANLKLSVSVLGTFGEVYHFLSLLETMPYKISIANVSLSMKNDIHGGVARIGIGSRPIPIVNIPPEGESGDAGTTENNATNEKKSGGAVWQMSLDFVLHGFDSNEKK